MVQQFSVDIEVSDGEDRLLTAVMEEELEKCLTNNGYNVRGLMWRATWVKTESYDKGRLPDSSD